MNRFRTNLTPILYDNSTYPTTAHSQLDKHLIPNPSAHRGMKRLESPTILRLRVEDKFTLVVPHIGKNSNDIPNRQRSDIMDRFKQILTLGITSSNTNERDQQYLDILGQRTIRMQSHSYYGFKLKITSYLECSKLKTTGLPKAHINAILDVRTGVGIYVNLIRYESCGTIHLKLMSLPYLEVFSSAIRLRLL